MADFRVHGLSLPSSSIATTGVKREGTSAATRVRARIATINHQQRREASEGQEVVAMAPSIP